MTDVALDANVIVALLDEADSQHARAVALMREIDQQGSRFVLLDFLLFEAVSVLCRRARERRTDPADLAPGLATVREWLAAGFVRRVRDVDAAAALEIVETSAGSLNLNDALVVVLHRRGDFDALATFDAAFASVVGLRMIPVLRRPAKPTNR